MPTTSPRLIDDLRVLTTIEELAARWHRANETLARPLAKQYAFTCGRMGGYEQALGLLLDKPVREIRGCLTRGEL